MRTAPSGVDLRDHAYKPAKAQLAKSVDLRKWASPVDDQYQLGGCVGNAIANAYELEVNRLYPNKFTELSRLFIYYNARASMGESQYDVGTTIRAGLQAVKKFGVCAESIWPYNIEMFDDRPSVAAYEDAKNRKIESYKRVLMQTDIMDALANQKPVVIALMVFSEFMELNQTKSTVPIPSKASIEQGGHAMCLVGYDMDRSAFLAKNSFGTEWGDQGYCWIPFEYAKQYAFEQWVFDISAQ